jgi:hypothetical protein
MSSIIEVVRPVVGYEVGDRYVVELEAKPWANMLDSGLIAVVEGATGLDDGDNAEAVPVDLAKPGD